MAALGAGQAIPRSGPYGTAIATRASEPIRPEPIRPAQLKQLLSARLLGREPCLKLGECPRVIFAHDLDYSILWVRE